MKDVRNETSALGYPEKIDLGMMKRINGVRILETVRRCGPISRASLAKRSRLSPPTVSNLVEDLRQKGLLLEVGMGKSSGGRRPLLIDFNSDFGSLVGLDISSTGIRLALTNLSGKVLSRRQESIPRGSGEELLRCFDAAIVELAREANVPLSKMKALTVAAPGIVDVERGRVVNAVNLSELNGLPLREILEARFSVKVVVDNDVNLAALGEQWTGCAQQETNFVFVSLGTGIGAGIILNGQIHRGSRWSAGEIGHMLLDYRQWDFDFGAQGFLESRLGMTDVRGKRPEPGFTFSRSGQLDEAHMRADVIEMLRSAFNGKNEFRMVGQEMAMLLGTGVANIVTVLDPSLVVFGGLIREAGEPLLDSIRRVVMRIIPNCPQLRLTALGDEAQLYGCIFTAMKLAEMGLAESVINGIEFGRGESEASAGLASA